MILVDANILMYAAGSAHPHRDPSAAFVNKILYGSVSAVIDTEVLQEILHRYHSLGRLQQGLQTFDDARMLFPEPLAITSDVMDGARNLLDQHSFLTARDAIHAAVVQVHQLDSICSFDRDFDRIPGLKRVEP